MIKLGLVSIFSAVCHRYFHYHLVVGYERGPKGLMDPTRPATWHPSCLLAKVAPQHCAPSNSRRCDSIHSVSQES